VHSRDEGRDKDQLTDGPNVISLKNLRTFTSFKNPVFRLFYGGLLGQIGAMNMQFIAGSLLLYRLTGSAAILAMMFLANALPMLALSLIGGVIADRVPKKYVVLFGQAGSALISLTIALALTLGYLSSEITGSWWILVVSGVFQGIIMGLMMPSRQAILPEIVGEEDLMNAVSLTMMGMNILQIFAPAIAGFLIDAFDFKAVYYTMTGLYVASVVFFIFMPRTDTSTSLRSNALNDIKEGFKYIRKETNILLVLGFSLIAVILSMPYAMLLPVFADDVLKVGASGLGMMMSFIGTGAIVTSITLASLPNKNRGVMLLASGVLLGLALTCFAFSNSWLLSLCLLIFIGMGQTMRMTLSNTLVQYYVDSIYRGRVMSLYMMQFGLASFGTFAAGLIAEVFGVQWAVGGFAVVLIVVSILALVFLSRIRRLD